MNSLQNVKSVLPFRYLSNPKREIRGNCVLWTFQQYLQEVGVPLLGGILVTSLAASTAMASNILETTPGKFVIPPQPAKDLQAKDDYCNDPKELTQSNCISKLMHHQQKPQVYLGASPKARDDFAPPPDSSRSMGGASR
ncbi:MAG: hypothetical protein F6J92_39950 [Symploca sp. SIO1A3]|nr:hypothetical protein [Symploca sp. SIO1A3]